MPRVELGSCVRPAGACFAGSASMRWSLGRCDFCAVNLTSGVAGDAGLKASKAKFDPRSNTVIVRFEDQHYGVARFHKGRTVKLTGAARDAATGRNLCFSASVHYCT